MAFDLSKVDEMTLPHQRFPATLIIQRQRAPYIPEDQVQLFITTNFVNANGVTIWNKGFSVQLEQLPEVIKMLERVQKKYADEEANKVKATPPVQKTELEYKSIDKSSGGYIYRG